MHYVHCAAMCIVRGDQRMADEKEETVLALEEEKWAMEQGNEYLGESEAEWFGQSRMSNNHGSLWEKEEIETDLF